MELARESAVSVSGGTDHFRLVVRIRVMNEPIHRMALIDFVQMTDEVESGDPRYHIDALLGLSTDADEIDLRPRYDELEARTFVRFAEYSFRNGNGIKLLYLASTTRRTKLLPSWVPDLNAARESRRPMVPLFLPRPRTMPYACAGGAIS